MCRTNSSRFGFTLVELMVAVALGSLVVLVLAGFSLYVCRSYAAMSNYSELDQQGQLALDKFTQQVRQVKGLTSYVGSGTNLTSLTFTDYDDQSLTFRYDSAARCLYRIKGGVTNVFLSGCDTVQWSIYQRNPQPFTFDAVTTAVATNCKLVQVSWTCSRNLYQGDKANTASVQSTKVALRGS